MATKTNSPLKSKVIDLKLLEQRVHEASVSGKYRAMAEGMGFTFDYPEAIADDRKVTLRMQMKCICGRTEVIALQLSWIEAQCMCFDVLDIDLVGWVAQNGSFSRSHLRADGYTETQIEEIVARVPPEYAQLYASLPGN